MDPTSSCGALSTSFSTFAIFFLSAFRRVGLEVPSGLAALAGIRFPL
jgi:hypothetical protein